MLPEEIKQLLELSGGKIVISQGDIKDSYIVMKLGQYLDDFSSKSEKKMLEKREASSVSSEAEINKKFEDKGKARDLTDVELLDKINSDIEQLRQRKIEREVESLLEEEMDEYDYDYL